MLWKKIVWYLLVAVAMTFLILAFLTKNWFFTIGAFALGIFLKRTNHKVELPKVYREAGIHNDLFEGKTRRDEPCQK